MTKSSCRDSVPIHCKDGSVQRTLIYPLALNSNLVRPINFDGLDNADSNCRSKGVRLLRQNLCRSSPCGCIRLELFALEALPLCRKKPCRRP
ncbi:hypothetical protein ABBQ38_008491 [Trebouxia sp. C0009 RCD-2024]